MPLAFLVPAFLVGLVALAVPLLLHLRHRERKKPVQFPSLMFLARIPVRTDQRRRITDWPLLLLRLLALALLVAAFARPFLPEPPVADAADAGLTVLLLDRSASMAAAGVRERWTDFATAVIDRLPGGRRVAVLAFDANASVLVAPTLDHGAARAALATAPDPGGVTRYSAGLRAAAQLLAAEAVPGEVVLVTDLQRSGAAASTAPALPAGTVLRTVAVVPDSRVNRAVVDVEMEPAPGGTGRRAVFAARIAHYGGDAPATIEARLTVDGRQVATQQVTLPPEGSTRVTFDTTTVSRAEARVEVAITGDALPADDVYHAVIPADASTRVLIVAPNDARPDEYRFVERALSIGSDPSLDVERVSRLDRAAIQRSAAIVMLDIAPPDGDVGDALTEWVTAGGGLVVVPGERLAVRRAPLPVVTTSMRGARERERGAILGRPLASHPSLSAFQGEAGDGFGAVRIRRHTVIEPGTEGTVLLRFDDGAPALVAGALGAGRTAVVAIPLDARRGDFPVQPAFLPFLRGVVGWAAGGGPAALALASGDPWLAPAQIRSPAVRGPDGEVNRPPAGSRFVSLRDAGFHEVHDGRVGGVASAVLAVNTPANESDLAALPPDELLLGVGEVPPAAAMTEPETRIATEARQQGWRWVLVALLGILIVEGTLASRGWRGVAARSPLADDAQGGTT